ncbi:hypothetical protein MMC09_006102 [Bachmanniomyces sp. S44760]|nr:hypothetical protein [Bachmanniomyces sp. S44760]
MVKQIDEALQERLRAALWFSIGKIVDEETLKLGVNATPQFIGALTEMVWVQIENVAMDLECFAKHAKRQTIRTEDVMLLSRRNEGLESVLRAFLDRRRDENRDGGGERDVVEEGQGAKKKQRRGANGKGQ